MASGVQDPATRAALDLWSAREWPFIVRRNENAEPQPDDMIAVGLPLPPSLGKRRFQFRLPRDRVAAHAPPLTLDEVMARLPSTFSRALAPLARAAVRERIVLRVFGSAAWEAETGLEYLRAQSDLDLLAQPTTGAQLTSILALLERAQLRVATRLDGEIVFPGGDAVAWREWAHATDATRVLVKNVTRVALVPRRDLMSKFGRSKLAA